MTLLLLLGGSEPPPPVTSGPTTVDVTVGLSATADLISNTYGDDGKPPPYRVVVLDPSGTPLAELENATVKNLTWTLNGPGSAEFDIPVLDPKASNLSVAKREVQIYRGSDIMWWGVVLSIRARDGVMTCQCVELSWYFTKRFVGTAETNYITNHSFELALEEGWRTQFSPYETGDTSSSNWGVEIVNTMSILGKKSLYMWGNGNMDFGIQVADDGFLWEVDPSDNPEGDDWSLVAWVYVPSSQWTAPRRVNGPNGVIVSVGIILQRFSTTETITVGGVDYPAPIENVYMPIDESTPQDTWTRIEVPFKQPVTGDTEIIGMTLHAPIGGIYYDNISIVRREALYFNDVDQATIVQGLVDHSQDTSIGKSDLRIDVSCPSTGIKRTRTYYYYNHELISDCLDEFPALWEGVDWSITVTPTTRLFQSHFPRRGTYKKKYALVLGKNISHLNYDESGEEVANSILVLADKGDGEAREEAVATDPGYLEGLTLENVYTATPGSAINTLQAQADRGVVRFSQPVVIPDLVTYNKIGSELIGRIFPGDVVPVRVSYGSIDLNDDYRVMELSLDPRTEQLTVTVNPETVWRLSQ